MKTLILIDGKALAKFQDGTVPTVVYSHDRNLLQFAHEALRRRHEVYFVSAGSDVGESLCSAVHEVFPIWKGQPTRRKAEKLNPDIVVSVAPQALNIKHIFPSAKIVAIQAAIQWLEAPELFEGQYVYDLITALRYNIDFIITQNYRMKEILISLYRMLSGWRFDERIIIAPLGIVPEEKLLLPSRELTRRELGLGPTDVALINSGGVWRWTDFLCFFDAFIRFNAEKGPRSRLKLMMPGVMQPRNPEHVDTLRKFEAMLRGNTDIIGKSLILDTDWEGASKKVAAWTQAADVGINVNTQSLESWQSHRLRFLDYMRFGLPVLSSGDDLLSQQLAEGMYRCVPGSTSDYFEVLNSLNNDDGVRRAKASFMVDSAKSFASPVVYGACIERIETMPALREGERAEQKPCVLDYANQVMKDRFLTSFKDRLLKEVY